MGSIGLAHSWMGSILPYVLTNKAIWLMDEGSSGGVEVKYAAERRQRTNCQFGPRDHGTLQVGGFESYSWSLPVNNGTLPSSGSRPPMYRATSETHERIEEIVPMKFIMVVATAMLLGLVQPNAMSAETESTAGAWKSLFNGKDLTGWKVKIAGYELNENFGDTFRVEDGVLKVCYDEYDKFDGRFGHLFRTTPYSHYILRLEYRFVGEQVPGGAGWAFRNSGIMIHGQSPESMRKNQSFPVSVEVQLLGGKGTGTRPTANVCTPGTHIVMDGKLVKRHCNSSASKTYHGDQWVSVKVEVHGNRLIKHYVNDELVMEYTQPRLDESDRDARKLIESGQEKMLGRGSISLQAESHPVEFRNIMIRELKRSN